MKTRKISTSVLFAGGLLIFVAAIAFAAEETAVATARVPFAFTVGSSSLPSGDYTFFRSNDQMKLRIRNREGHSLIALCSTKAAGENAKTQLVFHRYGDLYFLSEVQLGSFSDDVSLGTSKLEKEHINSGSGSVAGVSNAPEVVVVAAASPSSK